MKRWLLIGGGLVGLRDELWMILTAERQLYKCRTIYTEIRVKRRFL